MNMDNINSHFQQISPSSLTSNTRSRFINHPLNSTYIPNRLPELSSSCLLNSSVPHSFGVCYSPSKYFPLAVEAPISSEVKSTTPPSSLSPSKFCTAFSEEPENSGGSISSLQSGEFRSHSASGSHNINGSDLAIDCSHIYTTPPASVNLSCQSSSLHSSAHFQQFDSSGLSLSLIHDCISRYNHQLIVSSRKSMQSSYSLGNTTKKDSLWQQIIGDNLDSDTNHENFSYTPPATSSPKQIQHNKRNIKRTRGRLSNSMSRQKESTRSKVQKFSQSNKSKSTLLPSPGKVDRLDQFACQAVQKYIKLLDNVYVGFETGFAFKDFHNCGGSLPFPFRGLGQYSQIIKLNDPNSYLAKDRLGDRLRFIRTFSISSENMSLDSFEELGLWLCQKVSKIDFWRQIEFVSRQKSDIGIHHHIYLLNDAEVYRDRDNWCFSVPYCLGGSLNDWVKWLEEASISLGFSSRRLSMSIGLMLESISRILLLLHEANFTLSTDFEDWRAFTNKILINVDAFTYDQIVLTKSNNANSMRLDLENYFEWRRDVYFNLSCSKSKCGRPLNFFTPVFLVHNIGGNINRECDKSDSLIILRHYDWQCLSNCAKFMTKFLKPLHAKSILHLIEKILSVSASQIATLQFKVP